MDKNTILKAVNRPKRGHGNKMSAPIQITTVKAGHKNISDYAVILRIRDDVNNFRNNERWSYAFIEENERLYFFYDQDTTSYKVTAGSGYHQIKFTDEKLAKKIEGKTINSKYQFDDDSKFYFIQF